MRPDQANGGARQSPKDPGRDHSVMGGGIIQESGGGIIPLQGGDIIPELGGGFLRNQQSASWLAVLPLRAAPDRRSFQQPDLALSLGRSAKRLSLHLVARWMVEGIPPTICPPAACSRQTRIPNSGAAWMLEPRPLVAAPTAALAALKLAPTLLLTSLGADDVGARQRRGSEEFGPLDTMPQHQQGTDLLSSPRMRQPRHDATLDQILLGGAWSRTIARLGLK